MRVSLESRYHARLMSFTSVGMGYSHWLALIGNTLRSPSKLHRNATVSIESLIAACILVSSSRPSSLSLSRSRLSFSQSLRNCLSHAIDLLRSARYIIPVPRGKDCRRRTGLPYRQLAKYKTHQSHYHRFTPCMKINCSPVTIS